MLEISVALWRGEVVEGAVVDQDVECSAQMVRVCEIVNKEIDGGAGLINSTPRDELSVLHQTDELFL